MRKVPSATRLLLAQQENSAGAASRLADSLEVPPRPDDKNKARSHVFEARGGGRAVHRQDEDHEAKGGGDHRGKDVQAIG
eukprot:scaffold42278_cov32-Tisochrysis_lutea.AAC.2